MPATPQVEVLKESKDTQHQMQIYLKTLTPELGQCRVRDRHHLASDNLSETVQVRNRIPQVGHEPTR